MIKGSILQEDETMYTQLTRLSNYMRQKMIELQREIDESTIILGDFNTPPSEMNKSLRQQISKNILDLKNINKLDRNAHL